MAYQSSPSRATATVVPSTTTGSADPAGTSPTARALSNVFGSDLHRCVRSAAVLLQLRLDGLQQPRLDLRHADLADDVREEAVHHETACLVRVDAPRHQVEQLLVVEPSRGRGVA